MSSWRRLQRFARAGPPSRKRDGETCELCAATLPQAHRHVVDLQRRALCCSCPTCGVLFVSPAAGNRYRTVPDRVVLDPSFHLDDETWSALQIPVGLAFLFQSSAAGRWVAVYPSPAGATESELGLEGWTGLVERHALLRAIQPDVEALLVHRPRGGDRVECLLAPIDTCYELVALVRRTWTGFDGGGAFRRELAAFFERLQRRARPLAARRGGGAP